MHLSSFYLPFFSRLCLIQECGLNSHSGKLGCITLSMPRRFSPPSSPPNHREKIPNPHSNSEQVPVWVHVLNLIHLFFFSVWVAHVYFTRTYLFLVLVIIRVIISIITVNNGGQRKQYKCQFWIFIVNLL